MASRRTSHTGPFFSRPRRRPCPRRSRLRASGAPRVEREAHRAAPGRAPRGRGHFRTNDPRSGSPRRLSTSTARKRAGHPPPSERPPNARGVRSLAARPTSRTATSSADSTTPRSHRPRRRPSTATVARIPRGAVAEKTGRPRSRKRRPAWQEAAATIDRKQRCTPPKPTPKAHEQPPKHERSHRFDGVAWYGALDAARER